MSTIPQIHHGLCVADIDAARAALRSVGFTGTQPNAPEPLVYRDAPDDPVGQLTCPDLGSPYRTHYVENPATGHQVDLIEINAGAIEARPCDGPVEGDLVVTMPLPGIDGASATLAPLFGERLVVTDGGEPSAVVHYTPEGWMVVEDFYRTTLGVELDKVEGDRLTVCGIGGRLDIEVSDAVVPAPAGIGKRYAGANHFRFLHIDFASVVPRVDARPDCSWAVPPANGFAFVVGPRNETIELFDRSVTS